MKTEIKSLSILCVIGRGQSMLAGGSGRGMWSQKSQHKKGGPLGNIFLLQILYVRFIPDKVRLGSPALSTSCIWEIAPRESSLISLYLTKFAWGVRPYLQAVSEKLLLGSPAWSFIPDKVRLGSPTLSISCIWEIAPRESSLILYTWQSSPGESSLTYSCIWEISPRESSLILYTWQSSPGESSLILYTWQSSPGECSLILYTWQSSLGDSTWSFIPDKVRLGSPTTSWSQVWVRRSCITTK